MDFNALPQDLNPHLSSYLRAILDKLPALDIPTHLVRSDYLPTPDDRDNIKSKIHTGEGYIHSLDQELQHLQQVASVIKTQKALFEKYSAINRSLLSPIRKLPGEILARIFTFMSDIDILGTGPGDFWDIQRVCMRWRDAIRSTPSLWTNFKVPRHQPEDNVVKPSVAATRMKLCLTYSRILPLSISLEPAHLSVFPISVMETLAAHSDRWKTLTVDCDVLVTAEQNTKINEIINDRGLPMLRKLTISVESKYDMPLRSEPFSFHLFRAANSVEELTLAGTMIPSTDVFPWGNVRKLQPNLCFVSPGHWLRSALQGTPLLQVLDWCPLDFINLEDPNLYSSVVNLPSLRAIALRSVRSSRDPNVDDEDNRQLPMLFIPNLKALIFQGRGIGDYDTLVSSIQSSGSVIKRVELYFTSENFIYRVFEQFPNIEELRIDLSRRKDVGVELDSVIHKLVQNDTSAKAYDVLPSLRKLEMAMPIRGRQRKAIDTLVEVMRTRSLSPASIDPNSAKRQGLNESVAKLSHVVVTGSVSPEDHPVFVNQLEGAGKEYGIKVKLNLRPVTLF